MTYAQRRRIYIVQQQHRSKTCIWKSQFKLQLHGICNGWSFLIFHCEQWVLLRILLYCDQIQCEYYDFVKRTNERLKFKNIIWLGIYITGFEFRNILDTLNSYMEPSPTETLVKHMEELVRRWFGFLSEMMESAHWLDFTSKAEELAMLWWI